MPSRLLPRLLAAVVLLLPAAGRAPAPPADGVEHVVLCWLNEPGNAAHRDQVIRTTRELLMIPELRRLVVGQPLASERAIVDDSFDVGIVMNFEDAPALQRYLEHPEHVRRVREILQPLCQRVLVYDFAAGGP